MSITPSHVVWLESRAEKYAEDAEAFTSARGRDLEVGGLTGEQWAAVYKAVAHELRECAREVPVPRPRSRWRRG